VSAVGAGPTPRSGAPSIVRLSGDLDFANQGSFRRELDAALSDGTPIVVDLGECTHAAAEVLAVLVETSHRARASSTGFVVVLPYSASPSVRRTLLEIAPELADFAIVSSIRAAVAALERPRELAGFPELGARLVALRASFWENAARLEEHRARRNALLLEKRSVLADSRGRRRRNER